MELFHVSGPCLEGFREFARSLPDPYIGMITEAAEPLTQVSSTA